MSKNKNKKVALDSSQDNLRQISAAEAAKKIKALPRSKNIKQNLPVKTSGESLFFHSPSAQTAENFLSQGTKSPTQIDPYFEKYQDEKFNSVYSEINSKTSQVEAKMAKEVSELHKVVEEKFSSYFKWGIGLLILMPLGLITLFYNILTRELNNLSEKVDKNIEEHLSQVLSSNTKTAAVAKTDTLKSTPKTK